LVLVSRRSPRNAPTISIGVPVLTTSSQSGPQVPIGTVIVVLVVVIAVLGLIGWKVFAPTGTGASGTSITLDAGKLGNPASRPPGPLSR
jgi:hypothetical protein